MKKKKGLLGGGGGGEGMEEDLKTNASSSLSSYFPVQGLIILGKGAFWVCFFF